MGPFFVCDLHECQSDIFSAGPVRCPLIEIECLSFNGHGHRNTHRQMDVRRALLASCAAAAGACMVVDLHGKYNLAGRCRSLRPS